jgi:hypothetical protein
MNKIKYSDLTNAEKKHITNGCGGKGGVIKPPNFIFLASCNQHDFYFWRGCNIAEFKKANQDFYSFMKKDVKRAKWYLRAYYHIWAYSYYKAVAIGGKKYFYFAKKQKNIADLNYEINSIKKG